MNAEVEDDEEIGLLDLLTMLGEEKWAVLGVTLAATLTGLIVSLIVTPIFSSTALIMPAPQGGGGAGAAALAQLQRHHADLVPIGTWCGSSEDLAAVRPVRPARIGQRLMMSHRVMAR